MLGRSVQKPTASIRRDAGLVIILDLDDTLFDHTRSRTMAASKSLFHLNLPWSRSRALGVYRRVVTCSDVFERLGMPNFRLDWNSIDIYYVLKALCQTPPKTMSVFLKDLISLTKVIEMAYSGSAEAEASVDSLITQVSEKYKSLGIYGLQLRLKRDKHAVEDAKAAARSFSEGVRQISPSKETKSFLESIRRAGIDLCIVTEGLRRQQVQKIELLGLYEFVKRKYVFVVRQKSPEACARIINRILAEKRCCLKLAVIGDRFDKDLYPFMRLLDGRVIAIRLMYGKYARYFTGETLAERGLPSPYATIRNLHEATNMLISASLWSSVQPICSRVRSGERIDEKR